MCFELGSLPPIPPISGAALSHDDLVLEAADGARFAACAGRPDDATGTGVVVLPDVRGLYRFYEELAFRFAERGYTAVAIDYFGRTAGVGKRDEDFPFREHVAQTTPEGIQADVAAALEYLRSPAGGSCRAIFTVGFCFGGRHAWLGAAGGHGLAGAVGFYGRPGTGTDGSLGPARRASEIAAPILGPVLASPQYVPWSREQIELGAAEAGRRDHHRIAGTALFSVAFHPKEAKGAVAGRLPSILLLSPPTTRSCRTTASRRSYRSFESAAGQRRSSVICPTSGWTT